MRDCRNTYGESPHAARKSIPKRKAIQHQQERRTANQVLAQIVVSTETDALDSAESEVKSRARLKRLKEFKKYPDQPLGKVIKLKQVRRIKQTGRRKRKNDA